MLSRPSSGFVERLVSPSDWSYLGQTTRLCTRSSRLVPVSLWLVRPNRKRNELALAVPGAVCTISVYVDNTDEHFGQAVASGAKIVRSLCDEEYGARGDAAEDLEGHQWYFGNYRPRAYWESAPVA